MGVIRNQNSLASHEGKRIDESGNTMDENIPSK